MNSLNQKIRTDYAAHVVTGKAGRLRGATTKRNTRTPTASDQCKTVRIPIGLKVSARTDDQHLNYLLKRLAALSWLRGRRA